MHSDTYGNPIVQHRMPDTLVERMKLGFAAAAERDAPSVVDTAKARIASGFYDRDDVADATVDKVLPIVRRAAFDEQFGANAADRDAMDAGLK